MRIVTFNVNGLRSIREYYAVSRKWSFDQFLDSFRAEIICFQETKANDAGKLDHSMLVPKHYVGYYAFPKVARRIGYAGVVTFCKKGYGWLPVDYEDGFTGTSGGKAIGSLPEWQLDSATLTGLDAEARCMVTDHCHFVLFNVYFPNDSGSERTEFRQQFYPALIERCRHLVASGRAVIIAGDLNVSSHPIDHCDYARPFLDLPKELQHADVIDTYLTHKTQAPDVIALFYESKPLRAWIYQQMHTLSPGLVDCFRYFHAGETERYTCWNTQVAARGSNYGTRIDSFLASGLETAAMVGCDIWSDYMGSDHCPVWLHLNLERREADDNAARLPARQKSITSYFRTIDRESDAKRHRGTAGDAACQDAAHSSDKALPKETTAPKSFFGTIAPVPLCRGHGKHCLLQTVNKKGPNKGRQFYMCSQPVGHPTDLASRCNHFEWRHAAKR